MFKLKFGPIFCLPLLLGILLAGADPAPAAGMAEVAEARVVYVNRVRIPGSLVAALEKFYRSDIADGRYWYDRESGAWGKEDGPTEGVLHAGLALPAPVPADISVGGTGVWVNGRELHPQDVPRLEALIGRPVQGRYQVDAEGDFGPEGRPPTDNLLLLYMQRSVGM